MKFSALHLALSCDQHGTDGKDGKGVDDIEHGSIEDGFVSEDGGYHRVAHESYVSEHQRKADGTLIFLLSCEVAGEQIGHACQHDISDDADEQQRQDEAAIGQLARHRRREDECRTGDVDDYLRQPFVERAAHVAQFTCHEAYDYNGKECHHYD